MGKYIKIMAEEKKYHLELFVNNKKYNVASTSLEKALDKLSEVEIKTHGVLRLRHGRNKAEKILPLFQSKRYLGVNTTHITRTVFAKNMKMLLGE